LFKQILRSRAWRALGPHPLIPSAVQSSPPVPLSFQERGNGVRASFPVSRRERGTGGEDGSERSLSSFHEKACQEGTLVPRWWLARRAGRARLASIRTRRGAAHSCCGGSVPCCGPTPNRRCHLSDDLEGARMTTQSPGRGMRVCSRAPT